MICINNFLQRFHLEFLPVVFNDFFKNSVKDSLRNFRYLCRNCILRIGQNFHPEIPLGYFVLEFLQAFLHGFSSDFFIFSSFFYSFFTEHPSFFFRILYWFTFENSPGIFSMIPTCIPSEISGNIFFCESKNVYFLILLQKLLQGLYPRFLQRFILNIL